MNKKTAKNFKNETKTTVKVKKNVAPRGKLTKAGASLNWMIDAIGVRVAPRDLWQIYRLNGDVYSCIRELRQGVGNGGYKYQSLVDPEIEPDKQELDKIKQFWANSGGVDMVTTKAVRDCQIGGNAFFEIVESMAGTPWGLTRLDPRSIYIIANSVGEILKYVQRVPGQNDIVFLPNQIWHVVLDSDPDNELLGFSPLETAVREARTDISASESNLAFFENDAVPSTIYIAEEGVGEDEQKEAMKAIKEQFGGSKNRNKSGVLVGIKEVKTISMSNKDMEFIVGRKFNTDKICSVYGVPKFILGYTEGVNYSNGIELREKYYLDTIQPLEKVLANSINNQLFKKVAFKGLFVFLAQKFKEMEVTKLALDELKTGVLTLRQYKVKTGQEVTAEDEESTMIDKHVIHAGASAVLLDDVGVDPVLDPTDPTTANSILTALQTKARYEESTIK